MPNILITPQISFCLIYLFIFFVCLFNFQHIIHFVQIELTNKISKLFIDFYQNKRSKNTHPSMKNNLQIDNILFQSHVRQKEEQIVKTGVYVIFVRMNENCSYLEYDFKNNSDYLKFIDIFKSIRYHLDIFDKKFNEIFTISKDQYDYDISSIEDRRRIYLKTQQSYLQHGVTYVLAKNNSAIPIHTKFVLQGLDKGIYCQKLLSILTNQLLTSGKLQEQEKIPFAPQQDQKYDLQNQAIKQSFENAITFIKGPPGSGKTVTISRMVTLMAASGKKIIIGSTSDVANVTLINKIISELDNWNQQAQNNPLKRKLRMMIHLSIEGQDKLNENSKRFLFNEQLCDMIKQNNAYSGLQRQQVLKMIKNFQKMGMDSQNKSFEIVYHKCFFRIMNQTNIVVTTTLHSLSLRYFIDYKPEIGIIDQAALATLGNCCRFLSFGIKRLICVGDENQLEPFMHGQKNPLNIFDHTMLQIAERKRLSITNLKIQYRMHPEIAEFTNLHVYDGLIKNAQITSTEHTSNIGYFKRYSTSFIQHQFQQQQDVIPQSKIHKSYGFYFDQPKIQYINVQQGSLIIDFVIHLIPVEQWKNTTILTFYKKQMEEIEYGLKVYIEKNGWKYSDTKLTVKTVDGYQGGEQDYILISAVRSNPYIRNVDFFTKMNRVNVALTRAKKGFVVFGNSDTLKQQAIDTATPNIWGKFLQFNTAKNRVLPYQSLEDIMRKKNKQKGAIFDGTNLRWQLHYISQVLTQLQNNPQQFNKHNLSLIDKNQYLIQQTNELIKRLGRLQTQNHIRQNEVISLINRFFTRQEVFRKHQNSYISDLGKNADLKKFVRNFAFVHWTSNEILEAFSLIQDISQIVRILIDSNEHSFDETIIADNLVDMIRTEMNVKRQQIHQHCCSMFKEIKRMERSEKQKICSWLIQKKIMLRFINFFERLISRKFEYVRYES